MTNYAREFSHVESYETNSCIAEHLNGSGVQCMGSTLQKGPGSQVEGLVRSRRTCESLGAVYYQNTMRIKFFLELHANVSAKGQNVE